MVKGALPFRPERDAGLRPLPQKTPHPHGPRCDCLKCWDAETRPDPSWGGPVNG